MKKRTKYSIKIILIAILMCFAFYTIVTAASRASFAIEYKVRVLDESGNVIPTLRVTLNDGFEKTGAAGSKGYIDFNGYIFKLYPNGDCKEFTLKMNPSIDGGADYSNLEEINLSFKANRATNDVLTITGPNDEYANSSNLEYCSVEYNMTPVQNDSSTINITIKLKKKVQEPIIEEPDIDCDVNIQNIPNFGNVVQVISNEDSVNASISVADMVQYLKAKGITINQITDTLGNSISLTSTQLIGTDTILTASNGENYTTIVYGDATGDGQINAADISVIINYFLGTNENISQLANMAADVQQDGTLNAADMSLMINSFLGNLEGDILVKNIT